MPKFQRRDFLTGAAAFAAGVTAALTAGRRAEAGEPSFMNNVPDPVVSGKELPSFKFALEKSRGRVIGKNTAKEATVKQFPISKGIAGVSMTLAPGAMRPYISGDRGTRATPVGPASRRPATTRQFVAVRQRFQARERTFYQLADRKRPGAACIGGFGFAVRRRQLPVPAPRADAKCFRRPFS